MSSARFRPPASAFRCAEAARARTDQLAGTAPRTPRWLLVEHPGPWPIDAVAGSGIATEILQSLTSVAAATSTRILLIRRPLRAHTGGTRPGSAVAASRRWFLVQPEGPTLVGAWSQDDELSAALPAMTDAEAAETSREPIFLVCTHGVHDTCCALRGRPVAAALAERWPDATWECSHVGGDRFAPNLVVLPDGFYYGYLDPVRAVETVAAHLGGRVDAEWLRGLAAHPPAVQSAIVEAHRRLGPLAAHSIVVRSAEVRIDGGGRPRTVVDLDVQDRAVSVRISVVNVRRPAHQLTCRALRETVATEHQVHEFHERPLEPGPGTVRPDES